MGLQPGRSRQPAAGRLRPVGRRFLKRLRQPFGRARDGGARRTGPRTRRDADRRQHQALRDLEVFELAARPCGLFFATARYIPLGRGCRQRSCVSFRRERAAAEKGADRGFRDSSPVLIGDTRPPPIGPEIWSDTEILLPAQAARDEIPEISSPGETVDVLSTDEPGGGCRLPVAAVLSQFPVAVLEHLDGTATEPAAP